MDLAKELGLTRADDGFSFDPLAAAGTFRAEIAAQGGIAPTPDTSFLAAHLANPVLEINNPKEFLAPLAIETLATA